MLQAPNTDESEHVITSMISLGSNLGGIFPQLYRCNPEKRMTSRGPSQAAITVILSREPWRLRKKPKCEAFNGLFEAENGTRWLLNL